VLLFESTQASRNRVAFFAGHIGRGGLIRHSSSKKIMGKVPSSSDNRMRAKWLGSEIELGGARLHGGHQCLIGKM
jgi:hypothetical protein